MILDPLKISLSKEEIEKIKKIIEEKQKCEIEVFQSFNTIWLQEAEKCNGTELRLLFLGNQKITISRVCFPNKRQGTMSEIISFLEEICKEKEIRKIVFQSVGTKEMSAFCLKHGYAPNPNITIEKQLLILNNP